MKNQSTSMILSAFLSLTLLLNGLNLKAESDVKIWQDKIVIPTYQVGDPDPNPRFYDGRNTQGAQGRVYPYPMSDVLLGEKEDQTYDIIYLENDFVKISVIPALGGRIFSALDKTNNYDYFYRQGVIKPALIGTLGKWISGGSEWNFPHHHKATTMMRMDHFLQENEDGSVTLWLAETERRHRFRITLSFTLYPDRSYLEMKVNPYNPTPFVHSFLYFANPAVHVDSTYQVIFPPNVEYVVQHAKREFIEWPIANGRYNSKTYEDVDISWWKNLASPVSFFAWNDERDFFVGYDHGKKAGTAYVADHHTAPGMKFFTFGCGEAGKAWDKRLTDSDGPYIELMAGVFSDNQPDYSWAQPYENKVATQYWYPVRELGGMNYADLNGAMNLDLEDFPLAGIHLNTTYQHTDAKAVLLTGDEIVWEKVIDIGPASPFSAEVSLPQGADKTDVKIALYSADGEVIMEYQHEAKRNAEMPTPVKPPPSPEDMSSVEELYLAGLRLNQFYNANRDPYPFYEEALNRDPENYLVNTQLGILDCKGFRWEDAEDKLSTAVARITTNHTRPRDGEALYYLGISLRELNKTSEAYDAFYRATWSHAWHAASYFQLAELDCLQGDYAKALDHINRSISTGTGNLRALHLKTIILRKLGHEEKALSLARKISAKYPLDLMSRNELIILGKPEAMVNFSSIMNDEIETLLELAAYYGNSGCFEEALILLSIMDITENEKGSSYPMLYYYKAYYLDMLGDSENSRKYLSTAAEKPSAYCFPYRMESLRVLEYAVNTGPSDANALYYLGNLLFDHQPEKAKSYWEQAIEIDGSNPMLHRNLGFAYEKVEEDYAKASKYYESALNIKPDPRMVYELDVIYDKANVDLETRLDMFKKNKSVVGQRVDALTRQVLVLNQMEEYDEAINVLHDNYFYGWEGGREVRQFYVDAHLLRGMKYLGMGKNKKALADFEAANEYPKNLEEGRPEFNIRFAQIYYYMGLGNELTGNSETAMEFYRKAADEVVGRSGYLYYNYLANNKIGEKEKAIQSAGKLRQLAVEGSERDFFAKFGSRRSPNMVKADQKYMEGLADLAEGKDDNARDAFSEALELNPKHSWAKVQLAEIDRE